MEIPLLLSRLPDISAAAVSQALSAERGGGKAELRQGAEVWRAALRRSPPLASTFN